MSFDLNFYKKETNTTTITEMVEFLNTIPMLESRTEAQIVYENEETGVYFQFEIYEMDGDENDDENYFSNFLDTNLSFNINYIRPEFFGVECFEIVDKLVEKFDLFVLNPQEEGEPIKYQRGELLKSWLDSNKRFSKLYFKEFELNYLDLEKSNYSWKFCYNRNKLQEEFTEEYFVPNIFYIKRNGTETVETLCIWPEHIPIILPKVDFVLIERKVKKLFRVKKENGLVEYDTIIKELGRFFENKEEYKILHPQNSSKIKSIFNSIEIFSTFEKYGVGVSVDKTVNYKDK